MARIKKSFFAYFATELSLWFDTRFLWSASVSFLILYLCTIINTVAGIAATGAASTPVTDLILSNTPRFNTSIIHSSLAGFEADFSLLLLVLLPRYLPFAFKAMAGLFLLRAFFINLTNIGMFPDAVPVHSFGTFGGDLFFSGHLASAFLLALVFWEQKYLRSLYLFLTGVFGVGALLGHYHYSIDVFSAPFFAYGIFALSKRLFPADFDLYHARSPHAMGNTAPPFPRMTLRNRVIIILLSIVILYFVYARFIPFAQRLFSFRVEEFTQQQTMPVPHERVDSFLLGPR